MKKITPRDTAKALSEIIAGFKKVGPRYPAAEAALWLGRARKLILAQAAEIEDLKGQLVFERLPRSGKMPGDDAPAEAADEEEQPGADSDAGEHEPAP